MLRTKVDDVDTLNGLYEGQIKGQGSRSPGTKKRKTAESSPLTVHSRTCAVGSM